MDQWMIEAGKQAPWGVVIVTLVIYFLRFASNQSDKCEKRLEGIIERLLIDEQRAMAEKDATIKSLETTLAATNTALGRIDVLFTAVERDWNAKRPRS